MTIQHSSLAVEHVDIHTLAPYPRNPRHGDTDAIIESIRVNGIYKPIVIAQDGVVLAGNHTYAAAMELGIPTIPVVRLPIASDSPEAAKIVLADNRTSDKAIYDDAELLTLLRDLEDDLLGTAFSTDDLDDLLAKIQEDQSGPLDLSNVSRDNPNLADKYDKYQAMGRRMIVLDYEQDVYVNVTAMLARARARYDVDSNAEAVIRLLREVVEQ